MSQTHTQRRGSGYYYRQTIPADLIVHFGKREIVRCLKTSSAREASALRYEQGHYWAQELGLFEALSALPLQPTDSGDKSRVTYRADSEVTTTSRIGNPYAVWRAKRSAKRCRLNRNGSGRWFVSFANQSECSPNSLSQAPTSTDISAAKSASDILRPRHSMSL
jgi:hypothetical protein